MYPNSGWCKRTILIAVCALAGASCNSVEEPEQSIVESEAQSLQEAVTELENRGAGIHYSVWLGQADGSTWYRHNADASEPAASAIKSAILVEFFSEQLDSLDTPFAELDKLLDNPESAAIRHFDEEQQAAARSELPGLTARQLAEAMVHKEHIQTNAAYNAAANVIIEYLGGPAALTERVHRRYPDADGLVIARYMLADRKTNEDNLLTAESLATVLQYLAQKEPSSPLRDASRAVLLLESDTLRGEHYYKGGTLTSEPQVRIEAGWWEKGDTASVYVVIATRAVAIKGEDNFDELRSSLGQLSQLVQDAGIRIRDATLSR